MICINQNTAERNREPLEMLVRMRGSRVSVFEVHYFSNQEPWRLEKFERNMNIRKEYRVLESNLDILPKV